MGVILFTQFDIISLRTIKKNKKYGFHKILQIFLWITLKMKSTIYSYSQSYPHYPHICGKINSKKIQ